MASRPSGTTSTSKPSRRMMVPRSCRIDESSSATRILDRCAMGATLVGHPLRDSCHQNVVDPDFRGQSFRNRTTFGNGEDALALFGRQRPGDLDLDSEAVDVSRRGSAVGTVFCVHPVVTDADLDRLHGDLLPLRDDVDGHRGAGPERCIEEVIRRRAGPGTAGLDGLVPDQPVRPGLDLVAQRIRGADDHGFLQHAHLSPRGIGRPTARRPSSSATGSQYQVAASPASDMRTKTPDVLRAKGLRNGDDTSRVMMSLARRFVSSTPRHAHGPRGTTTGMGAAWRLASAEMANGSYFLE